MKSKIETISDLELELDIILSCNKRPKKQLSISQVFDFLAESIENSIQSESRTEELGFLQKIYAKYQLNKILSYGGFKKESQIQNFPGPINDLDPKLSESRLKTAITAFKLHSGPFGAHSIYGQLEKDKWEKILSYLSFFLFSYIELENDEKIRFSKEKEAKKERLFSEKGKNNHSDGSKQQTHHHNKNKHWKNKKKHPKGNRNHQGH